MMTTTILFSMLLVPGFQNGQEPNSPARQEKGEQATSKSATTGAQTKPTSRPTSRPKRNPATGSPEALALAKKAKNYAGGHAAWQKVDNIVFTFWGGRRVLWDKKNGMVRIEPFGKVTRVDPKGSMANVMLYDIGKDKGWIGGKSDKITTKVARGTWVNDTYWLLFALKILDPGTKLRIMAIDEGWMGEKKPDPGVSRLHLSFDNVGETPRNEYVVWIEQKTGKITRWDYYQTTMKKPLSWHFEGYKKVGPLLLSLKRAAIHKRGVLELSDVAINVQIPASTWKSQELVLDRIGRKPDRD